MRAFLSHNSADKKLAERIAVALHRQGIDPWLDKWEIYAGESLTDRIGDGIQEASAFVVLLSPQSVASRWVREELRAALQRRFMTEDFRVIPLLVADCEIPPFLLDYRYVDFRLEEDNAMVELIVALKRIPLRPPVSAAADSAKMEFSTVEYGVRLFGVMGETAKFTERLSGKARGSVSSIDRSIDPVGTIMSVSAAPFDLQRSKRRNGIEEWRLLPNSPIAPGQAFDLQLEYEIAGAFPPGERSWSYSIESPTEDLVVTFDFAMTDAPASFEVLHRIGRTVYPEPTAPQRSGARYEWRKLVPAYKDTYEIHFEW